MAEEFHLDFESETAAQSAERKLEQLRYKGGPAMRLERRGSNIFAACTVVEQIPPGSDLEVDGTGSTIPFYDLFYQLDLVKSGIHHPDGLMWIRTPRRSHSVRDERVPLVSVAPTMLGLLGIDPPPHMQGEPLDGRPAAMAATSSAPAPRPS